MIDFEPLGRRGECRKNETLLDCARRLGVGIVSLCGGQGSCHSCRIQVLDGMVSPPTAVETGFYSPQQLKDGWRLACQVLPAGDCTVHIPPESLSTLQRLQVEGLEMKVSPEPRVKTCHVMLNPPSLDDPQADADRLMEAVNKAGDLECNTIDDYVLREITKKIRSLKWQCNVTLRDSEIIALGPPDNRDLGLAVDLGTSKVSGYLIDLDNDRTIAKKGITNPQVNYGADIISRILYAMESKTRSRQMQKLIVDDLNRLAKDLCSEAHASVRNIVDMVVVGNTAMHHLLLGLPVKQLALSPYVPVISSGLNIKARDIGLQIAGGAYLYTPPNIAGFVGSDHTAVLLAVADEGNKRVVIALDIGTNTEVSIIDHGKIATVSCASGPAFEGWHIRDGMRATGGAIERLRIINGIVQYQTIDNAPPVGMCGSGILDAMAQLYLAGIVNEGGRMIADHPRVRSIDEKREFVLVSEQERRGQPAIVITQQDIRELQLAKAAIRTGIQVLLDAFGRGEEEIDEVIIAGAFGTYIDVANAMAIGMLPALPIEHFRQVGNAAGTGARLALISSGKRDKARSLVSGIDYIELAGEPHFTETFVQANYLGRYRLRNGTREEVR